MKKELTIGTILISKPFMEDKRFEKTIILIVDINEDGIIGFIINKNTSSIIQDIITEIPNENISIKYGGPVDDNSSLFYLHQYPDLIDGSKIIKNGVFWGGNIDDVINGINSKEINTNKIIFFLGYTGWEKHQLTNEIKEGSWIIHEINLANLYNNLNWSDLLIEVNKEYEIWATAPSDFHLN
jgi:putative transcriptional regulator